MKILLTGSAGFIGFHVANKLLSEGYSVVGLDSINNYYDVALKYGRLTEAGIDAKAVEDYTKIQSTKYSAYSFYKGNIEDKKALENLFTTEAIDIVIHLAAQVGVRYSFIDPEAYISSNIIAFTNILECCRNFNIQQLVYASSSSVYGLNDSIPFKITDNTDRPASLYAATKKSNELMAHVYNHAFNISTTGLRFFTVYGPWGRPDMALFKFADNIINNKPIQIYNYGKMLRDFTYVDDIVFGVVSAVKKMLSSNNAQPTSTQHTIAPYKIYNVGNNKPVNLLDFVEAIEKELNKEAIKEFLPLQPGEMVTTYADIEQTHNDLDYLPSTSIENGIKKFIKWYKEYYKIDINN